jgi:2-iminobutanoate/2-iminopropanoate deaminase
MNRKIETGKAPKAVGPYSQAVQHGSLLFVSGQIALDARTGEMVEGDISAQTRQVLENLTAVIEAAGFTLGDAVKCSCFLRDMNDFAAFNAVYGEYFGRALPARETVEVARLPKDARVEISVICGA